MTPTGQIPPFIYNLPRPAYNKNMRSIGRFFLFLGDVAALYGALFLALFTRYQSSDDIGNQFWNIHAGPFSLIFVLWVAVFYIAGLYDVRKLRNTLDFSRTLFAALFANAILSVLLFYVIPSWGITPKTTLLLVIAYYGVIETLWRRFFNRLIARSIPPARIALLGDGNAGASIESALAENPQMGYSIVMRAHAITADTAPIIAKEIQEKKISLVVISRRLMEDPSATALLYSLIMKSVSIMETATFYEKIFRKIPLSEIREGWFIENLSSHKKSYDGLKDAAEIVFALLLQIALLPLELLIVAAIKLTSPGPAVYSQVRTGKNGKDFTLYKFRSMRADAEKNGAQWSRPGDARVTPLGKILRASHLDELPQLLNILKGDLSFVGPRPERPEFVETLKKEIPHYEIRHLVKPGITGWAQISYRYGSSVEDAREKLQYDIYYIKNRSLVLDIAIVIKTIRTLFVNEK